MTKKDILIVENLAAFEKLINRDSRQYDIEMMVMAGALEEKHKNVDREKGIIYCCMPNGERQMDETDIFR